MLANKRHQSLPMWTINKEHLRRRLDQVCLAVYLLNGEVVDDVQRALFESGCIYVGVPPLYKVPTFASQSSHMLASSFWCFCASWIFVLKCLQYFGCPGITESGCLIWYAWNRLKEANTPTIVLMKMIWRPCWRVFQLMLHTTSNDSKVGFSPTLKLASEPSEGW